MAPKPFHEDDSAAVTVHQQKIEPDGPEAIFDFAVIAGLSAAMTMRRLHRGNGPGAWGVMFFAQIGFLAHHAIRRWCPPMPIFRRLGFRSERGIVALVFHVVIIGGAILVPSSFLFPFCLGYAAFGVLRFMLYSVLERQDRMALRGTGGTQSMEDQSR